METIRMRRELKLRDVEAFVFRNGFFGKPICYMFIIDYRRPTTLDDFPHLKEVEDEKDFGRKNFIRVILVSYKKIQKKILEEFVYMAEGLSENSGDCDWTCEFEVVDKKEFNNFENKIEEKLIYFEQFLIQHGFNLKLSTIPIGKFDYLSQD